jgi:hypothetical protein
MKKSMAVLETRKRTSRLGERDSGFGNDLCDALCAHRGSFANGMTLSFVVLRNFRALDLLITSTV